MKTKKAIISVFGAALLFISVASFAYSITPYFSLVDDPEVAIISQLDQAQETVDIAMYYFTDRDLANAVIEAHKRKVAVRVYLDKEQKEAEYSKSRYLVNNGVSVRYSDNPYIMHHNFCVIDNRIVITGSYSWTTSAGERSNENLLVIHDTEVAEEYLVEFNRLWTEHYIVEEIVEEQEEIPEVPIEEVKPEKEQVPYDPIVYITDTGNKYHSAGCRYLKSSCIPIKLSEAKAKGYTPCSVCRPPG